MSTLRWSVVWAQLDPVQGHEQAGRRPVLVISREPFNQRAGLVTVLPLTTARRPAHSWEVLIPPGMAGLPVESLVLAAQVRTLSFERLQLPALGRVTDPMTRRRIAEGVLRHLGFSDLEKLELEG